MATLEKVQSQIAKLQARADALIKNQSSVVIGKIRELMDRHGLTIADIDAHAGGKKRGRKPGSKATIKTATSAKYRDLKTGATWTGHGRAPAWIASAKDRTRFLIDVNTVQPAAVAKSVAKTGNYVRGHQAPKYRDPGSGATWSGRGRAPAWLVGTKDRSKFLIAAAEEGVTIAKPTPAKKGAAKKATTATVAQKKIAAKKSKVASKAPSVKKAAAKKARVKKSVAKKSPRNDTGAGSVAAPVVEATPVAAS